MMRRDGMHYAARKAANHAIGHTPTTTSIRDCCCLHGWCRHYRLVIRKRVVYHRAGSVAAGMDDILRLHSFMAWAAVISNVANHQSIISYFHVVM
jgi:hypothetical protein